MFTPDTKRVLVATDEGGERQHVVALDLASGKEVARYSDPGQAVIDDIIAPEQGGTVALTVLAGDHSESESSGIRFARGSAVCQVKRRCGPFAPPEPRWRSRLTAAARSAGAAQ